MCSKTVEKSSRKTDVAGGPDAAHPLDSWLKRELQGLDGAGEGEALPTDIAELAARLEDKLRSTGCQRTDATHETTRETTREESADRGRTSPRRGRKR